VEGVEELVNRVVWRLQTALPPKLSELRTRYGIQDRSLEDITSWLTHEPDDIAVDRPPMIVVVEQDSDALDGPVRLTDDGRGGSTFRWRYQLLVIVWARGDTFDSTALARRRYGLAAREVLLQMPGLGVDDPGTIVIDPNTVVESYSEVARDGQTREIIAATSIAVTYITQEYLGPRLPALGVSTTIGHDVGPGTP
jgi:hypothetical protein